MGTVLGKVSLHADIMKLFTKTFLRAPTVLRTVQRNKFVIAQEARESKFGLGVFTCQKVHKGDAVWWFDDKNCERLNEKNIKQVDDERLSNVLWKGYLNPSMDKFIVLEDGAQFTNHGKPANLIWGTDDETWIAARNIESGEEITFDYREFGYNSDCDWLQPLCEKLCPRAMEFEYVLKKDNSV